MSTTNQGTSPSLHDLSFASLCQLLECDGINPYHTRALWRALHRDLAGGIQERHDFAPPLRRWVAASCGAGKRFFLDAPERLRETQSRDGLTRKYLLRLHDGQTIETVLMAYDGRHTACISTQVGCAMGCVFCATGQSGFSRHLRPGEMVSQVRHVRQVLQSTQPDTRLRNLVLMGMGEPLHNYDAVMTALDILTDTRGHSLGPSRITISTVGLVPAILRMAREKRPYNLAVSLHGATDEERRALVPIGKKWPLAELISACREYAALTGKRIFFEWTLVAGANDSTATAQRLASLLTGIDSHINLIPLNPTGGFGGSPAAHSAAMEFQRVLLRAGFPCTLRQRRGIDVAAGCGQLQAFDTP